MIAIGVGIVKNKIRKWFEIAMLKIAVSILIGRNVQRSAVISRRDNNQLWSFGEQVEQIAKRIKNEYN